MLDDLEKEYQNKPSEKFPDDLSEVELRRYFQNYSNTTREFGSDLDQEDLVKFLGGIVDASQ